MPMKGSAVKRDMDLVRHILAEVERADGPVPYDDLVCEGWTMAEVAYHVDMMAAHGLVDATSRLGYHGTVIHGEVAGLTWDGTDYLDAIRDDGVWQRTKKAIAGTVGSTTMAVIKETAALVAMQMIKAGLGIQ